MKPVKQEDTPEISGGNAVEGPIKPSDIYPWPAPSDPIYPPAPITPVIDEPFITTNL